MEPDTNQPSSTPPRARNGLQRARLHKTEKRKRLLRILSQPFGMRCWYCGSELAHEKHIDHIIPKSKGGTDDWDNLALSCAFCNIAKRHHPVEDFLAWLDRVCRGDRLYQPGHPHPNSVHLHNPATANSSTEA